ncbi:MAG TPA: cytochrome c [Conexibacter sp.]|nr:cytochrome c [Conexibacter sp.]
MPRWIDGGRLGRRKLTPPACLLAAVAAIALAAGCGSGGTTRTSAPTRTVVQVRHVAEERWTYARERFRETCGGCHTLADAGTHGRRFNLDHSDRIGVETIHVRSTLLEGEPGMPRWRDVLSKRELEELVAYISTVAKRTPGETNWHWQIVLRGEGENWSPEDTRKLEARYANEAGGRPATAGGKSGSYGGSER